MARTQEEQTQSLAHYLPGGRVWAAKNVADTLTRKLLFGLAGELVRVEDLIDEFREEVLPDKTTLFIDEWERALGIPCECFDGIGTVEERRNDVLAKLAMLGIQTAEDIRALIATVYGLNVTITTPELDPNAVFTYTFPFTFGISEREAKFSIIIDYDDLPAAVVFPYTFPLPFMNREIRNIECLVRQLKPANVQVVAASDLPPPVPPPFFAGSNSLDFETSGGVRHLQHQTAGPSDFEIGNDFTIMFWVKPEVTGAPNPSLAIGLGNGSGSENRYWIGYNNVSSAWYSNLYDATNGKTKNYEFGTVTDGTWQQVIVTWNGTAGVKKVYANATEDASPNKITDDSGMAFVDIDMHGNIGANGNAGGGNNFDGLIWQVAVWNKVLTQTEITAIYNGGDALAIDLLEDTLYYQGAKYLKHWWWVGADVDPDLGKDHGLVPLDISELYNIDDTWRVEDFPT